MAFSEDGNGVTDELETMILMALDANHGENKPRALIKDKASRSTLFLLDQGDLLGLREMKPESAYSFDAVDEDREFATGPDLLLKHPADIIGEKSETIWIRDSRLIWQGLRMIDAPPKGVSCLGKASCWYEFHLREVYANGVGTYHKRIVPLDKKGSPLTAKIQGSFVCKPSKEGISVILSASLIEDAHRPGSMLASVKDATEIKFPVPIADYKSLFSERDGPMSGSRRKAIIHWVAGHLRSSVRKNVHAVRKHVRGVQEFDIDGLRIRLEPNDKP